MKTLFRKISLFALAIFVAALFSNYTYTRISAKEKAKKDVEEQMVGNYHPARFWVKYKEGVTDEQINQKTEKYTGRKQGYYKPKYSNQIVQTVQIPEQVNLGKTDIEDENKLKHKQEKHKDKMLDLMTKFKMDPDVESVDVVQMGHFTWADNGNQTVSDDYDASKHWYYEKTNLPEVWDDQNCAIGGATCGGDSSVTVAVLDSGVAYEDYTANYEWGGTSYSNINYDPATDLLTINLYTNASDPYDNGDEDGNGICDDYHGFDSEIWIENNVSNDPGTCAATNDIKKEGHANDDNGHGTYVTGIIASLTDNSVNSVASAHNVTIMPIKINIPFTGSIWEDSFYYAVRYAVDHGADIINGSVVWCNDSSGYLKSAVNYAEARNVTMVMAAGNTTNGCGITPIAYPARYSDPNMIAVGSINSNELRSSYSLYGSNLDIVAPVGEGSGEGDGTWQETLSCTWSCNSGSNFTAFSNKYSAGTSFAAPQVAAAAALVKGRFGSIYPQDIRNHLTRNAVNLFARGHDNSTGYGYLNLESSWNNPSFIRGGAWIDEWGKMQDKYLIGDFDGDGSRDDILQGKYKNGKVNWYVKRSTGNDFTASSLWKSEWGSFYNDVFLVGDFDNDGKEDLLNGRKQSSNTYNWYVARSTGASFQFDGLWASTWGSTSSYYYNGDLDADGFNDDLIQARKSTTYINWLVKKGNGSKFLASSTWKSNWGNYYNDRYFIGDFNHDNRDDLLNARYDSGSYNWYVARSTGSSFTFLGNWANSWGSSSDLFNLGDFDGDTYIDDMLQGKENGSNSKMNWYIKLSNTSNFVSRSTHNQYIELWGQSDDDFLVGNFDNDSSFDDIINPRELSNGKLKWYIVRMRLNAD